MEQRTKRLGIAAAVVAAVLLVYLVFMQLSYPLDPTSKRIIREEMERALPDLVWDAAWRDYFHYFTYFESLDGWDLVDSSVGSSGIDETAVTLATGSSTNDYSSIMKNQAYHASLQYDVPSRFRTAFQLGSVADVEFDVSVGVGQNGSVAKHYGFLVVNNVLMGTVGDGSAETTVTLIDGISAGALYLVEARFLPGEKVVFSVQDSADKTPQEKGVVTSGLPVGAPAGWAEFVLVTKTTAAKTVAFSFFEYLQRRIRF